MTHITFFEIVDGKPTLWDTWGPGRTKAVCVTHENGTVTITTDPEVVREFAQ